MPVHESGAQTIVIQNVESLMAIPGFMSITGEEQGLISGSSFKQGHEDKIEIHSFEHLVELPFHPDTQVASGEAVHRPITLCKEVDISTPKLYQALCHKEILETAEIRWFRHTPDGHEELFYMVSLQKGMIVRMKPWMPDFFDERLEHYRPMEQVSLVYEAILWSWGAEGDVEYESVWYGGASR